MSYSRQILALGLSTAMLSATANAVQNLPPPPVPAGNPMTPDKVQLGKALFWEEQLSSTRTVACGTCHFPEAGGGDPRTGTGGRATTHPGADKVFGTADDVNGSPGVIRNLGSGQYTLSSLFGLDPQVTRRKAPSVINAAYAPSLFWDGRAAGSFVDPDTGQVLLPADAALESQAAQPPISAIEMGHVNIDWAQVVTRIETSEPLALATNIPTQLRNFIGNRTYPQLFELAFGSPGVTAARTAMAIASYERTLISDQALIFDFPLGASTEQERGSDLFDAGGRCFECHTNPNPKVFTDFSFRNIGVRPESEDRGLGAITGDPADDGKFKVPSLLNVALRAPFFHNGSARTLLEVVEFYDRGGDHHGNQDPVIQPLGLTAQQRTDLALYLELFTDPRVAAGAPPFDRPTLWSETNRVPEHYGAGTPGTGQVVPEAIASEPPYLGNPGFTVGVRHGLPGTQAFLLLNLAPDPVGTPLFGVQFHLPLSPPPTVISLGRLQGFQVGQGYLSVSAPLRNDPTWHGLKVYGQWLLTDPAGPQGLSATEAFEISLFLP